MNVVPLIDILLVLLVIFMIIPHHQKGLQAILPQQSERRGPEVPAEIIVVQIASDGAVRINQSAVQLDQLGARLQDIFDLPPGSGCVSPGRSLARVSGGCPGSGPYAHGGRCSHRIAEF